VPGLGRPRACSVFPSGSSIPTISSPIWGRPWEHRGEAPLHRGWDPARLLAHRRANRGRSTRCHRWAVAQRGARPRCASPQLRRAGYGTPYPSHGLRVPRSGPEPLRMLFSLVS
jgi:hypothetical protein